MSIVVENLSKIYGTQKAVDNLSFEAKEGEILGFLGPNGAGKSTTMKIATCYLSPTSGTVKVCGYDVLQSPIEVRQHIGYLPEQNPLYYDMYVHEYLDFIASLHKLSGKYKKERIQEMIALCGLEREQNKKIGTLSKGYKQRVGLAQALIHDPKVLILDEPTTGLDPNQILEIRQVIKSISTNKTIIFSTHIMQEVQALCSRAIIINLGKIVANNAIEALQQNNIGEMLVMVELLKAFENVIHIFEALPHVKEVRSPQENKFEIVVEGNVDIRSHIFQTVVENKGVLLEMRKTENSLESVFRQLTH